MASATPWGTGQTSSPEEKRQRVAIARAIVGEPYSVVLADEPPATSTRKNGAQIMDLLGELHQLGSTLVIVTHDHEIAEVTAAPR